MPSVLPSTLPAGTKSQGGRVALTDVTLSGIVYRGRWIHEETGVEQEMLSPTCVDWSLVEIQPSPPQPETSGGGDWVPAIGAECEGIVSQLSCERNLRGMKIRGKYRGASQAIDDRKGLPLLEYDGETMVVDRESLKPISPPPGGSAPVTAGAPRAHEPKEEPSVGGSSNYLRCERCHHEESTPFAPGDVCPMCDHELKEIGGSSKSDPYAEHERELSALSNIKRIEMKLWFAQQDAKHAQALAAAYNRKLEQTKKDMDRPVSSHPRTWPANASEDADELYSTI